LWLSLAADTFLALEKAGPAAANVADGETQGKAQGKAQGKSEDAPGMHLLALTIAIDEREAWAERLARAGYPIYHQTAYTLYVRDPEGNRIGLSHWPNAAATTNTTV
jgi:hypothetical protein